MNAAEIKLDLFRKIDRLPANDLENIYQSFLALLNASKEYRLSAEEKNAIMEALEDSQSGNVYSHDDVMDDARNRFPNLRFR